jgi:uncharacterized membrane protein
MTTTLFFHVFTGSIALLAGAVALGVRKGGQWHRQSGMVFVISMLIMSSSGAIIAATSMKRVSVVAGLLAFYLVLTALLTVNPVSVVRERLLNIIATLIGLTTAMIGFYFGYLATQTAKNALDGYPAPLYFVFASIALLLRPDEVLSRIAHSAILKVSNNTLRGFAQQLHMIVGCRA